MLPRVKSASTNRSTSLSSVAALQQLKRAHGGGGVGGGRHAASASAGGLSSQQIAQKMRMAQHQSLSPSSHHASSSLSQLSQSDGLQQQHRPRKLHPM